MKFLMKVVLPCSGGLIEDKKIGGDDQSRSLINRFPRKYSMLKYFHLKITYL